MTTILSGSCFANRFVFCCLFLTSSQGIRNQFQDHWPILHLPNTAYGFHREPSSQNGENETTTKPFDIISDPEHRTGHFSNSASPSASVSSHVAYGQFPFPCRTRFFRLTAITSWKTRGKLAFISLLVFSVLSDFLISALVRISPISTSSLLVDSSAGLKFANVC